MKLSDMEEERIHQMWREHGEEMKKYHENCERINMRIIRAIERVNGVKFLTDVMEIIADVEPSNSFELVHKPGGKFQKEDYKLIKGMWVDQWSVGDSGDSFSGYVYVKLKPKMWLKMYFEC